jgi:predicted lipoprotein with Yx(FWY)xxD motif
MSISKKSLPLLSTAVLALVAAALIAVLTIGTSGAGAAQKVVSVKTVKGVRVFVSASGKTLYSPVQEKSGKILCVGACTNVWKPVKVTSATQFSGVHQGLGTVARGNSKQLAFHKHPLYTFSFEGKSSLSGDGIMDAFAGKSFTWGAARVSGGGSTTPPPSPYPGY